MAEQTMSLNTRIKLSIMMFLQFMMLPVWWVPLATYLEKNGMSGMKAWIMSTMALGCLASPLIGMFADRHFASQKVLATLNLLFAGFLVAAAKMTCPTMAFIMFLVAMLCYMPTWGLTSAIAMAHSPSEKFPQIRVFGSIGWVAAGLFSLVALWLHNNKIITVEIPGLKPGMIDGSTVVFYCGAAVGIVGAIFSLFLPNTPPPAKGQPASVVDALGLRAFSLFKHADFTIYVLVSILVMFAFSIYWSYFSIYLTEKGFELLTFTQNLGQVAEMFLMLMVPIAIAKVGMKWAMVLGLLAQLIRYGSLWIGDSMGISSLSYVAILVHGLIFGFFFVGGQIYVDRRAPKEMKAQAQGFMFLATFGVGLFIGNFLTDWLIKFYAVVENGKETHQWKSIWMVYTIVSAVVLVLFALLFRDKTAAPGAEVDKK